MFHIEINLLYIYEADLPVSMMVSSIMNMMILVGF